MVDDSEHNQATTLVPLLSARPAAGGGRYGNGSGLEEELAMTYRLSIGGKLVGDLQTLEGCWAAIDAAYGQFEDRYSGGLRFRITDKATGRRNRSRAV